MKIKIAYYPGEGLIARTVAAAICNLLPKAQKRTFNHHPPLTHIYIETPKPHKPRKSEE